MDIKQFDVLLHDAEVKMKRLKALYEQWFQGVERLEPTVPRKDLDRLFQALNKEKPRNTAARFRLQQLQARYNVYVSYWQRVARQIEEGTYERDLRRVRRRRGGVPMEPSAAKTDELDVDVDVDALDSIEDEIADVLSALEAAPTSSTEPTAPPRRALSAFSPFAMSGPSKAAAAPKASRDDTQPSAPNPFERGTGRTPVAPKEERSPFAKPPVTATFGKPKPAAPIAAPAGSAVPRPAAPARAAAPAHPAAPARPAAPPRPPAPPIAPRKPAAPARGGDDPSIRRIYDQYLDARRRNNESVDNVRYDKIADSVTKMRSKLQAKHGSRKIDFEVVVQNGRVGLKPKIE